MHGSAPRPAPLRPVLLLSPDRTVALRLDGNTRARFDRKHYIKTAERLYFG